MNIYAIVSAITMGLLPDNLSAHLNENLGKNLGEGISEKALNVKKALADLKDDVMKTLSPYALDFINQYAERYTGIKPADLRRKLGITPEQEAAASSAATNPMSTPASTPAPNHQETLALAASTSPNHQASDLNGTTQGEGGTPLPPIRQRDTEPAPTPSSAPTSAPAQSPTHPETPPLPLDHLRTAYAETATFRDSATVTTRTRDSISRELDFALRMAPNYLTSQLLAGLETAPPPSLETVEREGVKIDSFSPLIDLSAFNLNKLRSGTLKLDTLKQKGIRELVLMEDRDPLFFLNFQNFSPNAPVPLNRHGATAKPAATTSPGGSPGTSPETSAPDTPIEQWTMGDLKKLIDQLHQSGIKMTIGFWGNFKNVENNPFLKRNREALKPLIPGSDDLNPLSIVKDEQGQEMAFADYIVEQYRKLHQAFGFDGLFLGDGLMGYRDFKDPNAPYDFSQTAPLWTDFYRRVHQGVHSITPEGKLWAFDVLGKSPADSLKHGVDLNAITPYLDTYVFQAYGNDAWGQDYMALPGYDLARDRRAIAALPPALQAKTRYTVGIGDQVEGWRASPQSIAQKAHALTGHAQQGTLGVWSNEALRAII